MFLSVSLTVYVRNLVPLSSMESGPARNRLNDAYSSPAAQEPEFDDPIYSSRGSIENCLPPDTHKPRRSTLERHMEVITTSLLLHKQ